jgi:hypothetical protein
MTTPLRLLPEPSTDPFVRAAVDNAPPLPAESQAYIMTTLVPAVKRLLEARAPASAQRTESEAA